MVWLPRHAEVRTGKRVGTRAPLEADGKESRPRKDRDTMILAGWFEPPMWHRYRSRDADAARRVVQSPLASAIRCERRADTLDRDCDLRRRPMDLKELRDRALEASAVFRRSGRHPARPGGRGMGGGISAPVRSGEAPCLRASPRRAGEAHHARPCGMAGTRRLSGGEALGGRTARRAAGGH
jgi:hypothetical protein